MVPSFEQEMRTYIKQRAEQDPLIHGLERGEIDLETVDPDLFFATLWRVNSMQTNLLLKIAVEIDEIRAATNGG